MLSDREQRLVHALAQTLFTRERAPRIDGTDAHVVQRFARWYDSIAPSRQAPLIAALTTFDLAFGVWLGAPGTPFAAGLPADRIAFVEVCLNSGQYLARQGFEGIRFALLGAYGDSPEVHAAIGMGDPVATARARFAQGQTA